MIRLCDTSRWRWWCGFRARLVCDVTFNKYTSQYEARRDTHTHTHAHTRTHTHTHTHTRLTYKHLTHQQHKYRRANVCVLSHTPCEQHLYWSVAIETSWLQSVAMECDYSMLWIFSLSLSLLPYSDFFSYTYKLCFLPRLLLFCKNNKNKAGTHFSSLVGRSSSSLPQADTVDVQSGGGGRKEMFLRGWQDLSRIRGDGVSVKVWQLVWESMWRKGGRGREGGRRWSWMDGMTGGSFTLQVMCGFKIQLFFICKPLFILYFICELFLHRLCGCNWRQADEGGRRSEESWVWSVSFTRRIHSV